MLVPSCVADFANSQLACYQWTRRSCGISRHIGVWTTPLHRVGMSQEKDLERIPATHTLSVLKRTAVLDAATQDVVVCVCHFHYPSLPLSPTSAFPHRFKPTSTPAPSSVLHTRPHDAHVSLVMHTPTILLTYALHASRCCYLLCCSTPTARRPFTGPRRYIHTTFHVMLLPAPCNCALRTHSRAHARDAHDICSVSGFRFVFANPARCPLTVVDGTSSRL